jgi:N-acetylmuramoyl-L-alanine amidase
MRCITLILIMLSVTFLAAKNVFSQEKRSMTKVVIDAGHGGKDPGTIGKKSQEKNVALQIALKLSEEIRSQCKGVTVICTRTTDEFIELHERAEIANRSKADLFISIHCNANPKHTFQGAETYVMGLHRTEANLEIAKKENAAILMEPDYSINYNGFDPNSDESYITFTLFQNAYLEQSTRFASIVQDEMKERVGMNDRGVRQAGFLVLYKTTMPSVLVETGFLSNPDEEKFLISEKGQQYISAAICRAFRKFKAKQEGNGKEMAILSDKTTTIPASAGTSAALKIGTSASAEKQKEEIPGKDTAKPKVKSDETASRKDTVKQAIQPKKDLAGKETMNLNEKPKVNTVKQGPGASKENLAANPVLPVKTSGKPVARVAGKTEAVKSMPAKPADEVVFRVQIATSPKELSTHSKKFAGLPEIWTYQHQGLYKYTAGKESSPDALADLLAEAKKMGFADAFIVAFHGEERITVAEGRKLMPEIRKK